MHGCGTACWNGGAGDLRKESWEARRVDAGSGRPVCWPWHWPQDRRMPRMLMAAGGYPGKVER